MLLLSVTIYLKFRVFTVQVGAGGTGFVAVALFTWLRCRQGTRSGLQHASRCCCAWQAPQATALRMLRAVMGAAAGTGSLLHAIEQQTQKSCDTDEGEDWPLPAYWFCLLFCVEGLFFRR